MKIPAQVPSYLGQDLDVCLIQTIAPFIQQAFFVDVGAEKGSFSSAMLSLGMRGAMFEPMARHHKMLSAIVGSDKSKAYQYAIDEKDGLREFFVACDADDN